MRPTKPSGLWRCPELFCSRTPKRVVGEGVFFRGNQSIGASDGAPQSGDPARSEWSQGNPLLPAVPWIHLLWLWLLFMATAQGRVGNTDSSIMLAQTRSMLTGTLALSPIEGAAEGVNGTRVSQFGVLTSVIWIPFVWAGRILNAAGAPLSQEGCEEFMVSFCGPFAMTGIIALLCDFWRRLGAGTARMVSGIWLMGTGSMLWTYSKLPGSDVWMALFLMLAFREWLVRRDLRSELMAGMWLGLAVLARKQAQVISPLIAMSWILGACWQEEPVARLRVAVRSGLGLAAGAAPAALVVLWYNQARFGSPFLERYPNSIAPSFELGNWLDRVFGMVAGSSSGLLWYATPMVAMFGIGLLPMMRRLRFLLVVLVLVIVSQIGFLALFPFWQGGTSAGPRLLLFAVPLMAIPYGTLPLGTSRRWSRLGWASYALGALVTLPCILTDPLPVERRLAVDHPGGNHLVSRLQESAIVLGLADRPASHAGRTDLVHPPFQVPDVWWCQVLRELRQRRLARLAAGTPDPSSPGR